GEVGRLEALLDDGHVELGAGCGGRRAQVAVARGFAVVGGGGGGSGDGLLRHLVQFTGEGERRWGRGSRAGTRRSGGRANGARTGATGCGAGRAAATGEHVGAARRRRAWTWSSWAAGKHVGGVHVSELGDLVAGRERRDGAGGLRSGRVDPALLPEGVEALD